MYITAGPGTFGFNFKCKEEKIKYELSEVIDYFKYKLFDNANIIHKDRLTIETIEGLMQEILEYYDIEYLNDDIVKLIKDVIDKSEVNEVPTNSIISKITKYFNEGNFFN